MNDDDRAGEELARAWLQGKSELIDDLAALVDGMDKPLDATARAFLHGWQRGKGAQGKARPTPAGAPGAAPAPQTFTRGPARDGLRCRRVSTADE